ncbi:SpoIIE family protein phosphatase [Nocardioides pantholopis]|uniref:SpoIIE family protein phosphatase n=1 Tax=Nocardioides pantholopis TaxID=2483798 RepID=UPI000FDC71E5|nr:SpoIIE family protein phosphatase [Nocardioides pantholopis]
MQAGPPAAPTRAAGSDHGWLDRVTGLAVRVLGASSACAVLDPAVRRPGTASELAGPAQVPPVHAALADLATRTAAPVVIADAAADSRLADQPAVVSREVGACLAVPLLREGTAPLGALCVLDREARAWSEHEVAVLVHLAAIIVADLDLAATSADHEDDRLVRELAVEAAGVGIFDWDLGTGVLNLDERLVEIFGRERGSFRGTVEEFEQLIHPEDRAGVQQALQEAIASCGQYAAEYRTIHPGGAVRWVTARGRALAGPEGVAVRVLGAAYDTTAVQDGEARLARVLETMPTAFFQLSPDWRFSYANAEAGRMLDTPREEMVGGVIWELFPEAVGSTFETHYRDAMSSGRPATFDAYYPPPLDAWYEVRAWPHPDGLSVYFNDITSRRLSDQLLDQTLRRSELLAGVSATLTDTLDAEEAVARLARVVVPELADWCVVTLVEDRPGDWQQQLRDVGWWHADPEQRQLVDQYASRRLPALTEGSFIARALASPDPVVVDAGAAEAVSGVLRPGPASDLLQELAPDSLVVVRLPGRRRTVGLVSAFRGPERGPFSDDDQRTLREIASRAGLAIDNARLYGEQRDLAEGLQRSLLTEPPQTRSLDIAVRYESAGQAAQVGGDWYDAFVQRDGGTVVVIGDVVGHDVAAAAAMGQIRSVLRGIAVHAGEPPAEVLRGVDQAMETLALGTTATAVVARFDAEPTDGLTTLRWSNAGHPPPMLVDPDGTVTVLQSQEPDLLLGLDPGAQRDETFIGLPSGSTVVLFTDGLVERRGQDIDDGLLQLQDQLVELRAHEQDPDPLCAELLRRLVPDRREDDVALVAVRVV